MKKTILYHAKHGGKTVFHCTKRTGTPIYRNVEKEAQDFYHQAN